MATDSERGAAIYRYRIPLVPAITCAGVELNQRQGLVIRLRSGDDKQGYGEIAPLPGFSPETLDHALQDLTTTAQDWLAGRALSPVESASVRFGYSCALHELEHGPLHLAGHERGSPVYRLLQGDRATLQQQLEAQAPLQNQTQPETVKLKLARLPIEQEITLVQQLLQHNPQQRLRIDCNRGWSLIQAQQFVASLTAGSIEYLEEPCSSLNQTLTLASQTGVPIALDETLRQDELARQPSQLPLHPGICALVIKPSLTGSIDQTLEWIKLGSQRNLRTILSSSYESSLGVEQLTALARRLTPNEPAGLDTLGSFSSNLLRGGAIDKPTLPLEQLECLWHS